MKKKTYKEQQEELLKYRNHYRGGQTRNKTPQDRKIKLSDIKIDKEKLRNLLSAAQIRKPKKRHYYDDIYSEDGVEPDNEFSENDDESSMKKLSKRRKRLKQGGKL